VIVGMTISLDVQDVGARTSLRFRVNKWMALAA